MQVCKADLVAVVTTTWATRVYRTREARREEIEGHSICLKGNGFPAVANMELAFLSRKKKRTGLRRGRRLLSLHYAWCVVGRLAGWQAGRHGLVDRDHRVGGSDIDTLPPTEYMHHVQCIAIWQAAELEITALADRIEIGTNNEQ